MENTLKESSSKIKTNSPPHSSNSEKYNINSLIDDLKNKEALPKQSLINIIKQAYSILKNQPTLIKVSSPVIVVGDIHGQFHDLLNLFQTFGFPPKTQYLFLGDYVDRGRFCIQVITLLLAMKINYPTKIHLLRGNHEGRTMTTAFNFKTQCQYKYKGGIYENFLDLFTTFPLCGLIDERYFAVHGGISPHIKMLADILKINRFLQIPDQGTLCDLLWSDPSDENREEWIGNRNRSCSYYYSRIHASKFLKENSLRLIIRGHQVQMSGYKYQYGMNQEPLTLTIFSAPRYCDTYKNKGAVAIFSGKNITIQSFKEVEHPFVLSNYQNAFELSFPAMASAATKIFGYLLRSTRIRNSMKLSQTAERSEILKALEHLQSVDEVFGNHAEQIKSLLLTYRKNQEAYQSNSFLEGFMDLSNANERMPVIFGPHKPEFVRIGQKKTEEDISPQ